METNDFLYRTNVNSFSFRKKKIYVYEDHRTILNALFFHQKSNSIFEAMDIISFDYHDDACEPKQEIKKMAKEFDIQKADYKSFNSIVDYELSSLDDDWKKAGMELGLIQDTITFGVEESYGSTHEEYIDNLKRNHQLMHLGHLSHEMGGRGALGDSVIKEDYYSLVREKLAISKNNDGLIDEIETPFVLDFDLDCFSAPFRNKQMAWSETMLKRELYCHPNGYHYQTPHSFINQLIDQAQFITICLESPFCGGYGESFKILRMLDEHIFEHNLNTSVHFP